MPWFEPVESDTPGDRGRLDATSAPAIKSAVKHLAIAARSAKRHPGHPSDGAAARRARARMKAFAFAASMYAAHLTSYDNVNRPPFVPDPQRQRMLNPWATLSEHDFKLDTRFDRLDFAQTVVPAPELLSDRVWCGSGRGKCG